MLTESTCRIHRGKKDKKNPKPQASHGICPRVPSLTRHKKKKRRFERVAARSPLFSLSCSNTRATLKGKQTVCPGLLFYLWINWSHLWIVCLSFFFFFGTPDQPLTSGGVSREAVEGRGREGEGSPGCLVERSTSSPGNEPPTPTLSQLAAYKIPRWHPADGISCFPVSAPGRTIISQWGVSLRC